MQKLILSVLVFTSLAAALTLQLNKIEPLPLTDDMKRQEHTINLGGSVATLGEFYATITLGTPAQTLNVQMDTGSSDLLVFGRLCTSCASNVTYGAIYSTSYEAVPCDESGYHCPTCGNFLNNTNVCSFSDYYGDGSGVNGSVLTDILTVGDIDDVTVSFGYIMNSSKGFEYAPVDGIWGISYPDLGITTPALFTLFKEADIYEGFSMCLTSPQSGVTASMTFGKPETSLSSFQFTPIVKEEYYNVDMTDLRVNGKSIGVSNYGMSIVDSGTTLMIVPGNAFAALQNSFAETSFCQSNSQACDQLFNQSCITLSSVNEFPTLQVVLKGVSPLSVPPSVYMIEQQGSYCLGIASSGDQAMTILGDTFMGAFNVFFDIQNSQIGFASTSTCPN